MRPGRVSLVLIGVCAAGMAMAAIAITPRDSYTLLWQSIDANTQSHIPNITSWGGEYQLTGVVLLDADEGDALSARGFSLLGRAVASQTLAGVLHPLFATIEIGRQRTGDIGDLRTGGGNTLSVGSIKTKPTDPWTTESVFGLFHNGSRPDTIDVEIVSSITSPGGIGTVRLRNWATGEWDRIDQYAPTISTSSFMTEGVNAAAYVRDEDGRIEISIRHEVFASFQVSGFESGYDRIAIRVH